MQAGNYFSVWLPCLSRPLPSRPAHSQPTPAPGRFVHFHPIHFVHLLRRCQVCTVTHLVYRCCSVPGKTQHNINVRSAGLQLALPFAALRDLSVPCPERLWLDKIRPADPTFTPSPGRHCLHRPRLGLDPPDVVGSQGPSAGGEGGAGRPCAASSPGRTALIDHWLVKADLRWPCQGNH